VRQRLHKPVLLATIVLALALCAPRLALADAPGTRGEQPQPVGNAGDTGDWRYVEQRSPTGASLALPAFAPQDDTSSEWIGREINVGSWILDAGMGIGSALLATLNYALLDGLRALSEGAPTLAGCGGHLNILWCTPPELFLDPRQPIGGVVRTIWGTLEPVAISLIGVLFVVRIGRLMATGPAGLAAEGKAVVIAFAVALVWIKSADTVLRFMMAGLNEFHSLVMTQALRTLLDQSAYPVDTLNIGLQATTLVMVVALLALVVKALMRVVQLTLLIGLAPLMGALLMDRSTSARFGQWLGKLIDVLLQQTAWVFFLWFGALFYAQAMPADPQQIETVVTGRVVATVVFGMALGGESILAGIASATAAPGGLIGSVLSTITSGRFAVQALRYATRSPSQARSVPATGDVNGAPDRGTTAADPRQSAAAKRKAVRHE
jgi:hypothetical protein